MRAETWHRRQGEMSRSALLRQPAAAARRAPPSRHDTTQPCNRAGAGYVEHGGHSALYFGNSSMSRLQLKRRWRILVDGSTLETILFAMDRRILLGSLRSLVKWRFASVDAKARKRAAGTHLVQGGFILLVGGGPFSYPAKSSRIGVNTQKVCLGTEFEVITYLPDFLRDPNWLLRFGTQLAHQSRKTTRATACGTSRRARHRSSRRRARR